MSRAVTIRKSVYTSALFQHPFGTKNGIERSIWKLVLKLRTRTTSRKHKQSRKHQTHHILQSLLPIDNIDKERNRHTRARSQREQCNGLCDGGGGGSGSDVGYYVFVRRDVVLVLEARECENEMVTITITNTNTKHVHVGRFVSFCLCLVYYAGHKCIGICAKAYASVK